MKLTKVAYIVPFMLFSGGDKAMDIFENNELLVTPTGFHSNMNGRHTDHIQTNKLIQEFIDRGVKKYPIEKSKANDISQQLKNSYLPLTTNEITAIIEKDDPDRLGQIGGFYITQGGQLSIDRGLPWVFLAAKKGNTESLWQLASLIEKGYLSTATLLTSEVDEQVLVEELEKKAFAK